MKIFFPLLLLCCLFLAACKPADPLEQMEAAIRAETQRSPGEFAVAFLDLQDSTNRLLINAHEEFHAASTMKTPVMIEIFKQAEAGRFDLQDSMVIRNEFMSIVDGSTFSLSRIEDSGDKYYSQIGGKATIYDLTYDMIINSSNLATNIVIGKVGAEEVTQTMRELGAPDIEVLRGVEDLKAYERGMNNTTTAYDLMKIFEAIGEGNAVSPAASQAMIDILLDQSFSEVIPALLPENVRVAHKTGTISTVDHDSGLVLLPDGRRYVLVTLSGGFESRDLARDIMSKISLMVYEYMMGE